MTAYASDSTIRETSVTVSSLAFLIGLFHLGALGDKLRENSTAPTGLADRIISPLNLSPRSFAGVMGMGTTLIIIPPFLALLIVHKDPMLLVFILAATFLYLPLIHPTSNHGRPE